MRGEGLIEFYDPNTNIIHESYFMNNMVMDNVIDRLAGLDPMYQWNYIDFSNEFNDDTDNSSLLVIPGRFFTKTCSRVTYANQRYFTVEVELEPLECNGLIAAIGYRDWADNWGGKNYLFNRVIIKQLGSLLDNTSYSYKIVPRSGSNIGIPTDELSITTDINTGSNINKNSIKITWSNNGTSNMYDVYRKTGAGVFQLVFSTPKTFFYDNGYTEQSGSFIPTPIGSVDPINILTISKTIDAVPRPIMKTDQFAARVKIKIYF